MEASKRLRQIMDTLHPWEKLLREPQNFSIFCMYKGPASPFLDCSTSGVFWAQCFWPGVLGLTRTGLIFIRCQEGTQPGWLTQTGQTKQGIQYHVPSCWVPRGGADWGEVNHSSGVSWALGGESCSVHIQFCGFFLLVLLLLLFTSFDVSVNLPLSRPKSFYLFLSILLPTTVVGRATEQPHGPLLLPTAKRQH